MARVNRANAHRGYYVITSAFNRLFFCALVRRQVERNGRFGRTVVVILVAARRGGVLVWGLLLMWQTHRLFRGVVLSGVVVVYALLPYTESAFVGDDVDVL